MLFKDALGEILRELRTEQGMKLRVLSSKSSVALGYLSEIERGHKEVSSELLDSICDALGVATYQVIIEAGYRMNGNWHLSILNKEEDLEVVK